MRVATAAAPAAASALAGCWLGRDARAAGPAMMTVWACGPQAGKDAVTMVQLKFKKKEHVAG